MQYLAKVSTKSFAANSQPASTQLQLLAVNSCDQTWELVAPARTIAIAQPIAINEEVLVIVELDADEQISAIKDATTWVLGFVSDYLTLGLTPKGLEEELERAEQWRQSLTLQSQEVRRRALETAARRDEIQDLEKRLKLERETLESSLEKKE